MSSSSPAAKSSPSSGSGCACQPTCRCATTTATNGNGGNISPQCPCGDSCQCTETLCRCEASNLLNSLSGTAERKKKNNSMSNNNHSVTNQATQEATVATSSSSSSGCCSSSRSPAQAAASQQQDQQNQDQDHDNEEEEEIGEFWINGMTCTMCSQAIEGAVQQNVKGITGVHISLATDTARITYSNPKPSSSSDVEQGGDQNQNHEWMHSVKNAIQAVGYDVEKMRLIQKRQSGGGQDPTTPSSSQNQAGSNPGGGGGGDNGNSDEIEVVDDENNDGDDEWQQLERRQQAKVQSQRRAFLYAALSAVPILMLTMVLPHVLTHAQQQALERPVHVNLPVPSWFPWQHHHNHGHYWSKTFPLEGLLLWMLATPVQIFSGWGFYKMAVRGLIQGRPGMDVLVAVGTTASYLYALYGVWNNQSHHASHFFETAVVLMAFVLLGKWLQALAMRRTSQALLQLLQLQSKTALKVMLHQPDDNNDNTTNNHDTLNQQSSSFNPLQDPFTEQRVPIQQLQPGDMVKIVRGASIPADGRVAYGDMSVDESMVTGEPMPVLKSPGSTVLGGTVCVETNNNNYGDENNAGKGDDGAAKQQQSSSKPSANNSNNTKSVGASFVEVTGVGSNTALAQIISLVQQAQTRQVPVQSLADQISSIFVPTVCLLSVVTFLVWYTLCQTHVVPSTWYQDDLHESATTFSLMFALACLVISCPCALGLATPTAVMVGTGVGATHGVLFKGGEALEVASRVTAVVFDKTGTLTHGKPVVSDFVLLEAPEMSPQDYQQMASLNTTGSTSNDPMAAVTSHLLWLLASLERTSEHPLAQAVVEYAEASLDGTYRTQRPWAQPSEFRAYTGRGAAGVIGENTAVAVGNRSFCSMMQLPVTTQAEDCMKQIEEQGKTAILAAVGSKICAVLGIADEVKEDAAASIAYLQDEMNIDVWMVTGDNSRTARAVREQLGLKEDRVIAEALPAAKLQQVRHLQDSGAVVCMVGDGLNDSPALAQADVGISLGTGAAIAAEAADMVLVKGHVADVCTALELSRAIFARIQLNFLFSLIYNCLGIPVAAGVFYPLFQTRLPPTLAALAMALSSVSVVLSSLTLRLFRPPDVDVYEEDDYDEDAAGGDDVTARQERGAVQNGMGTEATDGNSNDDGNDLRASLLSNDRLSQSEATDRIDNRTTSRMEEGRHNQEQE